MVIDWLFARPCCRIDDSSSRIGVYAVVAGTSRPTGRRKRTQTMTISVTSVSNVTSDLVEAMNRLLPELSSSASPLSAEDLHEIVESPATVLFIARSDIQTIVGTLTLVFFRLPTGLRAWIEDVIVGPDARGLGVGAALCQTAIRHASEAGAVSIDLTSRPSRVAANQLYQKLGFQQRETNVYRYTVLR